MMIEIRWHGRGGQGVWTASNLLAVSASSEGKYVQSFPAFGPERSGAPVLAFTRISDEPIDIHSMIYEPDVVVVLDETLVSPNIVKGLKKKGVVITNFTGTKDELIGKLGGGDYTMYVCPASKLALEILGRGITNTAMVGAFLKAVNIVKLETVIENVRKWFKPGVAEKNVELVRKAYELTSRVV
uniref:pyruvate synthase n=1 Tax=Staphylothermus marinus TaxID=2280 RepID=A0A7C4JMS9_STAMA